MKMKLILHVFQNHNIAKQVFREDIKNLNFICDTVKITDLRYEMKFRGECHWYISQKMPVSSIRGHQPYEIRIKDFIDLVEFTKLWGPQLPSLGRTYE